MINYFIGVGHSPIYSLIWTFIIFSTLSAMLDAIDTKIHKARYLPPKMPREGNKQKNRKLKYNEKCFLRMRARFPKEPNFIFRTNSETLAV